MAIYLVKNLSLVAQPTDGVCWWASLMMLYKWSKATGKGSMIDPLSDAGFMYRYEKKIDWPPEQNWFIVNTLKTVGILSNEIQFNYASLESMFQKHGPIFMGLQRNWYGHDYGHAVVLGGVADTGVLVYDPMPIGTGSLIWLTWAQLKKAYDAGPAANPEYLAAV